MCRFSSREGCGSRRWSSSCGLGRRGAEFWELLSVGRVVVLSRWCFLGRRLDFRRICLRVFFRFGLYLRGF